MRDKGPIGKCFKCKKRQAQAWYMTKPVCTECFNDIRRPRIYSVKDVLRRKREARGINF